MRLLRLFYEFFKTGLFSVGGGMATIPFLEDMGASTGWFTNQELTTMIAVSESTPGPLGVNMATYVGYHVDGVAGAVTATLGLICPCVIVILIVAGFLQRFRQSKTVEGVFRGLRPASTALIAAAGLSVAGAVLLEIGGTAEHTISIRWPSVLLAGAVFAALQHKKLGKIHPAAFIAAAALVGIVFRL